MLTRSNLNLLYLLATFTVIFIFCLNRNDCSARISLCLYSNLIKYPFTSKYSNNFVVCTNQLRTHSANCSFASSTRTQYSIHCWPISQRMRPIFHCTSVRWRCRCRRPPHPTIFDCIWWMCTMASSRWYCTRSPQSIGTTFEIVWSASHTRAAAIDEFCDVDPKRICPEGNLYTKQMRIH